MATNYIDSQTSFSTDCGPCTADIEELDNQPTKLARIIDLMGKETAPQKNIVFIYVYSNGTTERIFE